MERIERGGSNILVKEKRFAGATRLELRTSCAQASYLLEVLPCESRLSRCERYRGIIGIESQENRSIYRQVDVGTFSDERIAKSLCGAKVSEPDCRAHRCLRRAGTEQAEAFPAFAGPRPCCLLGSRVRNCSRWAYK